MKVTASDADDPTYGSSAKVVYRVLDGERFFTVDKHTGKEHHTSPQPPAPFLRRFSSALSFFFSCLKQS